MKKPKGKQLSNLFGRQALEKASRTAPGGWGTRRIGTKPMARGLETRQRPITPTPNKLGNV